MDETVSRHGTMTRPTVKHNDWMRTLWLPHVVLPIVPLLHNTLLDCWYSFAILPG